MPAGIAVERLAKSYRDHRVLNDLSLTIDGGVFALLGRNGAGKTTLLSILTTLIRPDSGTVTVAGFDVVREQRRAQAAIAVTGQYAAIDQLLTGRENLELFGRLRGLRPNDARQRAGELLEQFDLVEAGKRATSTYSGGMARRLDIAASMIVRPAVLFLDEPTTGLDLESRQHVWCDVRELARAGTTIFLTTQYLEEAEALADRIAVLAGGGIVADGTAADLKRSVGGESVALVTATGAVLAEIPTDGTRASLAAAIAKLPDDPDAHVELRRPTLDDAFLAITGTRSLEGAGQ